MSAAIPACRTPSTMTRSTPAGRFSRVVSPDRRLSAAQLLATISAMANPDQAYALARERYAELGVDVERAMTILRTIPISLHCWQGDDVGGFETAGGELGGGLAVTGNYPGKARNA